MIHYVVREGHSYTIREFLDGWGQALRPSVSVIPYERIFSQVAFDRGTYVFSDLERITPIERAMAAALFDRLEGHGVRALNHPRRALTRFPLLRRLADLGINRFRAHRLIDPGRWRHAVWRKPGWRYPVFLRTEHAHDGNLTPLLHGPAELLGALLRLARHPMVLRAGLLVVEFEDTRDPAGLYRKYSVLRVGEAFVPRHAFVSGSWMLKHADIVDAATAGAELAFVREHPHREQVVRAFEVAGIDYGRMDYSVRDDGRIVVWEINTNPMVVPPAAELHPLRLESQSASAALAVDAFRSLEEGGGAVTFAGVRGSVPDSIPGFFPGNGPWLLAARIAARLAG